MAPLRMGLFDFLKPIDVRDAAAQKLARDWESQVDPASGKTYYWNKATGETSWLKPDEGIGLVNRFRGEVSDIVQEDLPFGPGLLRGTYLQGRVLECIYKASRDGWSARQFHTLCDYKGPCVVVSTTVSGARFGAMNPIGWSSDDDYRTANTAFLFFWPTADTVAGPDVTPVVLEKVGGGEAAIFDYARSGPHFGADGLVIGASQAATTGLFAGPDSNDLETAQGQLKTASSRLGQSYARIPAEFLQSSLFGGDAEAAELSELEVYSAPELATPGGAY